MADHLPKNIRQTFEQIRRNIPKGAKAHDLLDQLDKQLSGMVPAEGGGVMRVESMVASETKNPEVIFIWGTNKGVLSPVQAKGYAFQILETCEAAIQDAALYRAATEKLGEKDPAKADRLAWALIQMVRENRAQFEEGGE